MDYDRTEFCKCNECLLNGSKKIYGEGPDNPKIAIITDMPSKDDDKNGHVISGAIGYKLSMALAKIGISRADVYIIGVMLCHPEKPYSIDAASGLDCCYTGFLKELEWLKQVGCKVLVPVKDRVLRFLKVDETINKSRGSIYYWNDFVVVPTYHPDDIRKRPKEELTWLNDLEKAVECSVNPPEKVKEDFNIYPKIEEIEAFADKCVQEDLLVAVDIETSKLDPYTGEIVVVGMAISETEAISFPKYSQGHYEYWHNGDRLRAINAMRKILASCRTMFQNAMYDVFWLMVKGFEVNRVEHDIMLLHHAYHAELPHNLEYINSVYGKTQSWKSVYGKHGISIFDKSDSLVRTYNCRDVVVLHQILPSLMKAAKDSGTYNIYQEISMQLIKPLIEMEMNGLLLDRKTLGHWKRELAAELSGIEKEMRKKFKLPDSFKITSNVHQQMILFDEIPGWYNKVSNQFEAYDLNTRLKKNTKKYAEIVAKLSLVKDTVNFDPPKGLNAKKTDKGQLSVDEEALSRYIIAAKKRIIAVENLKKIIPNKVEEAKGLRRAVKYVELLQKHAKVSKLISTYTNYTTDKDNIVHTSLKICGTKTGRLSSSEPNLQNPPAVAKKIFIAREGEVFINIDYSNLELRVLAVIARDDVLQEVFDKGLNVHDINAAKLFNIDKHNPKWKMLRRVAKTYIFGRNYGGGLANMYKNIMIEVDDFDMTLAQFKQMDRDYFNLHPKYAEWREGVEEALEVEKMLTTPFKRRRIFLGSPSDAKREGLNFPIQSPASDIVNTSIIKVYNVPNRKFNLVLPVHDSLMVSCKVEDADETISIVKPILEHETVIGSFPTDVEIGFSYGYMVDYDVWKKFKEPTRKLIEEYCKKCKEGDFLKLSVEERIKQIQG